MRTRLVPLAAVQQLLEQGAADVDLCTNHCGSDAHRGAPGPYTTHLCSGAPQAPQEMAALVLQDHDAGTGLADTLQNAHQVLHVADVKYRQLQPYVACVTSGAAACVRLASLGRQFGVRLTIVAATVCELALARYTLALLVSGALATKKQSRLDC
jgi:hypothetical protein